MIKKRARPNTRIREISLEVDDPVKTNVEEARSDEEIDLPLEDLLELRKLRRAREGIDVGKLNKGELKKRKKKNVDADGFELYTGPVGLSKKEKEEEEEHNDESKIRKVVKANNFTQQTNALDVDKHMIAYIEESMKMRHKSRDGSVDDDGKKPLNPDDEFFQLPDKYKVPNKKDTQEEGSVTNSLAMLTAIPEVDLGMDARLKNIEETEKAKRAVAEVQKGKRAANNDEEHLSATRFYKPNLRQKSDADIIRDAKLEAMGLRPEDHEPRRQHYDKPQTATDELVMERFKKRMRK